MTIRTKNMIIDPDLCKRLDKNFYSDDPSVIVTSRSNLYRTELLDLIGSYNPKVVKFEKTSCLYRLYTIAERLQKDFEKHDSERRNANIETAHNQLKNYK